MAAAAGGVFYYLKIAKGLPDVTLLHDYQPSLVTKVFDQNGFLLKEYFIERRFLLRKEEIPKVVIQATLATEDARFEEHPGVDLFGILRAALANFMEGSIVEGGSTITQQLAKTLMLTPERSLVRKIREAILAVRIERSFKKREILNLYLNQIYYGHGSYGIEAASRVYFGKGAKDLRLPEAALLAGLPRAPNYYNPIRFPERARKRRAHVLRRMMEEDYITPVEFAEAELAPISLTRPAPGYWEADYVVEHVRRRLERLFGAGRLYRGGLRVYTTIDLVFQRAATSAVRRGILRVDRRRGYRGVLARIPLERSGASPWKSVHRFLGKRGRRRELRTGRWEPAQVLQVGRRRAKLRLRAGLGILRRKDAAWARPFDPRKNGKAGPVRNLRRLLRPGDIILVRRLGGKGADDTPGAVRVALVQEPRVQAAAIVIEPGTGAIRAMVGGYDFEQSKFNRAVQAVRPPGSAFKPVTYSAAISTGWSPSDVIIDAPIIYPSKGPNGDWKPTNYREKFYGPTTLREALALSRNIVTVKLAQAVGIKKIVERARLLGIRTPMEPNLSVALGSSGVRLVELTALYGALAKLGRLVEPHVLLRVEDPDGKTIWQAAPSVRQTIAPEVAYVTLSLLKNVIEAGTARRARSLKRPLAGKTGTTNDYQDAWFIGVSPFYAAGVWVGMDDKSSLGWGETGARAALPIWMNIVKAVHAGLPARDFPRPPKVTFVSINPKTGLRLRPGRGGVRQAFVAGTEPPFAEKKVKREAETAKYFREDADARASGEGGAEADDGASAEGEDRLSSETPGPAGSAAPAGGATP
ncbi:MAG: PBP1A family penicillin-binding protein [bacterium]